MKMMFHIDDFKCTLCANWFCPPFNLPYLLPCTHSICTSCLQKASNHDHIICPQDLQTCSIQSININQTTKKALQRLMKQHKNYNQNTQLQCIKSLSIGFDQVLSSKQKNLRNLQALIDQIFSSEIDRLKYLHQKIKTDINRPYRIVQDWKEIVACHLTSIRKNHHNSNPDSRSNSMLQLNHYIEQGRKIKMDLNQFFQLQFDIFADKVMRNPRVCFDKDFGVNMQTLEKKLRYKVSKDNSFNHVAEFTNGKATMNTCVSKDAEDKQQIIKNKQNIIAQSALKKIEYQIMQNSKNGHLTQNKKEYINQSQKTPLNAIDINKMTSMKRTEQQNQKTTLQTKRGMNKQKINYNKTVSAQPNSLDSYFATGQLNSKEYNLNQTYFCDKENNKNCKSKLKRQLVSPHRGFKYDDKLLNKYNKNSSKPKNTKYQTKKSQSSIQKKSQQYSLSQFHLQTQQTQSDNPKKIIKQNKLKQMISPYKMKSKGNNMQKQKQSPNRMSCSQISQIQRMSKLSHMLGNKSAYSSNSNSNYNSQRTGQIGNASKVKNNNMVENKNVGAHHSSLDTNSLLMSPNTIREQYTEQGEQEKIPSFQEQLFNNNQQLLINDTDRNQENGWCLGKINFLKEWKMKSQNNEEQPLQIRQNTYYYNCQKQKLSYMRKMQVHRAQQAFKLTIIKDNYIELINQSLHDVDMSLYLSQFDWKHSNIQIVKFVKTSLNDEQLNVVLNFLIKSNVKALVLSGNNLTDLCLDAFLNFVTVNNILKNVYLPKNFINIMKSKAKISLLKQKGVNIYV